MGQAPGRKATELERNIQHSCTDRGLQDAITLAQVYVTPRGEDEYEQHQVARNFARQVICILASMKQD